MNIKIIIIVSMLSFLFGQFIPSYPFECLSIFPLIIFCIIIFYNNKIIVYFLIIAIPLVSSLSNFTRIGSSNAYFSMNMGGVLNLGTVLLTAVLIFLKRVNLFKLKFSKPLIFFLGILGVSIFFADFKLLSFRDWIRYAMPICLYLIILRNFNNYKQIYKLLQYVLFSSVIPFVAGFWQLFSSNITAVISGLDLKRISGTFFHPSYYAMFVLVIMLLALFLLLDISRKYRYIYVVLFFASIILLFNTFTRVAWISGFVSISILGFLKYRKFYILFLLTILGILFCFPHLLQVIYLRLLPDSSFLLRFDLMEVGISFFKENFLFGSGLGSFGLKSQNIFGTSNSQYGVDIGLSPHNDYIRFLVNVGILGFGAFLFLYYSALKLGFQICKSYNFKGYGVFLISFIVAMLVFGITDQGYDYANFYLWIFLAIGEIMLNQEQLNGRLTHRYVRKNSKTMSLY